MFTLTHLHPMIVHFPIALVTIGFLAELASLVFKKETSLPKISSYLLIIGTLAAIAAVLAGVFFTEELTGEAGSIEEKHAFLAFITTGLLFLTSLLRFLSLLRGKESKTTKQLTFVLYLLSMIAVSVTGFLGGTLVYSYMMPL
ncbi:MAG TPA: DUF2231 domain-containing protein [Bacteroidales bacterium]|nr:DUF2231 domain-containing protein [Bacteroidales bacterium]